jgi:hypothetical protein
LAPVTPDPWVDLDPLQSPAVGDRLAREQLGHVDVHDPRRVAGLVSWLLQRAALDGSTVVSVDVVAAALRAYDVLEPSAGVELALRRGGWRRSLRTACSATRWSPWPRSGWPTRWWSWLPKASSPRAPTWQRPTSPHKWWRRR